MSHRKTPKPTKSEVNAATFDRPKAVRLAFPDNRVTVQGSIELRPNAQMGTEAYNALKDAVAEFLESEHGLTLYSGTSTANENMEITSLVVHIDGVLVQL